MESGLDDAGPVESGPLSDSIVSLADMLARDVRFEWYEALATTLQLCHGITQSTEQTGPTTLQLDNIYVAPVGDVVALTRPQHPATAVPRVAHLFGDMLPDFHRRTTFQAVIAEATSDPPGYASLEALAEALAPFERPHRVEIVRGVYQRWRLAAATALPPESDALDIFLSEGPSDSNGTDGRDGLGLGAFPDVVSIAPEPILAASPIPEPAPSPRPSLTPNLAAALTPNLATTLPPSLTPKVESSLAPNLATTLTPNPSPELTAYTPSFTAPVKRRARPPFWRGQAVFLLRASALAAVVVMIASLGVWALRGRRPAPVADSPVAKQAEPISDKQETQKLPATPERTVASTERAAEPPAAFRRLASSPPPSSAEALR